MDIDLDLTGTGFDEKFSEMVSSWIERRARQKGLDEKAVEKVVGSGCKGKDPKSRSLYRVCKKKVLAS